MFTGRTLVFSSVDVLDLPDTVKTYQHDSPGRYSVIFSYVQVAAASIYSEKMDYFLTPFSLRSALELDIIFRHFFLAVFVLSDMRSVHFCQCSSFESFCVRRTHSPQKVFYGVNIFTHLIVSFCKQIGLH